MECPRCKEFGRDVKMVRRRGQQWDERLGRLVTVWYWVCPVCGYTRG
jgi:transposase-like protein